MDLSEARNLETWQPPEESRCTGDCRRDRNGGAVSRALHGASPQGTGDAGLCQNSAKPNLHQPLGLHIIND